MKALIAISIFFLASTAVIAAEKTATKVEEKKVTREIASVKTRLEAQALARYLDCRGEIQNDSQAKAFKACVANALPPGTSAARVDRMGAWLLLNPEVYRLRDCRAEELDGTEFFSEKTPHAACFDFRLYGENRSGVAFFKVTGKNIHLYSFHY